MTETVIYHCHFWNEHIRSTWNKLLRESGRQCYLVFDSTNTPPPDVERLLPVTLADCKSAGYPVHPIGMWHNADYGLMLWKDRIEGDRFWKLDHDIRFTGNWGDFFNHYTKDDSDLLAPGLRCYNPDDGWPWWSVGNCLVPLEKRMAGLFCIYRITRKSLDELERQYRSGQSGFSEMIMPSVLNSMGYVITDMVNADYFDHSTFKPGPIRPRTSSTNKIEHPIRESRSKLEVDDCRDRLSKWCVGNGLDIGFGGSPIVSGAICIDRHEGHGGRPVIANAQPTHIAGEADRLPWFADNSFEYAFSSHLLEDFLDTQVILSEWLRVIKPGGHLVLFLPDQAAYVKYCHDHNSLPNGAHKHDNFSLDYVKSNLPNNCQVVHEEWPFPGNPYSFSLVVRKT